ncbi:hypothetical protein [Burkholderia semiarida]|uniref:hypothetical protein n=1 Tax=Burkholderia semiarida TaxID=2843303 RepID=UPI003878109D
MASRYRGSFETKSGTSMELACLWSKPSIVVMEECGIPKKVGKEFISAQHGKSTKGLPERKRSKK